MKRTEVLLALLLTATRSSAATPRPPDPPRLVVERALRIADTDKDGRLNLAEYLPLDVQAKHHGAEHFAKGDADHDNYLDPAELAATLRKQTWFAILSEGVEKCFARLDADADRRLDAKEYRKISRMGGHAEQHHRGADTDQDGFLNLAEFTTHAEARLKAAASPGVRKKRKRRKATVE